MKSEGLESDARTLRIHEKLRQVSLCTVSAVAVLCSSGAAMAQTERASPDSAVAANDDVQAVVVTAQRRSELSRDVPITITTVRAQDLAQAHVDSLASLPKVTPGLRFDQQGAYTQPTIRGVGTSVVQTGAGSSVGIYVDGFYSPTSQAADLQFLNVESVQVLKGPQGTLFGRNTTGGAILVQTADPSTETHAILDASYERFSAQRYQAYFTTGLTDNLAFGIEGLYSQGDGYLKNIYDGSLSTGGGFAAGAERDNPGAYEDWSVRTSLLADVSSHVSFLLRYAHNDNDDPRAVAGGAYVSHGQVWSAGDSVPGAIIGTQPGEVANNARTSFHFTSDTVQLTGRFDLGFADLTSYTQYRKETIDQYVDSDGSSALVLALSLPEDDRTISQELLLTSKPGGPLQYTAGAFLYEQKVDAEVLLGFGAFPFSHYSATGAVTRTYAAFGDATYEFTPNWFFTAGLRYSHDEVNRPYYQTTPGVPGVFTYQSDYSDENLTPRFVVRYKPNDASSIYASFTRGYKSAIPDYRSTSGGEYLRPEEVTAYEIGYKYEAGPLGFELAAFHYDYKDLQNAYYEAGVTILSNAATAQIQGIESSLRYNFGGGFEVSAAGTYLDAQYQDYANAGFFNPVIIGGNFVAFNTSAQIDASGNQMQRAPKFSGTLRASYTTDLAGGTIVSSANLYHSSTVYFDPAHQFSQGAYDLLSARVEWTDPNNRYTIAVFGDNLLDENYLTQAYGASYLGAAFWGSPTTYGVSVRLRM